MTDLSELVAALDRVTSALHELRRAPSEVPPWQPMQHLGQVRDAVAEDQADERCTAVHPDLTDPAYSGHCYRSEGHEGEHATDPYGAAGQRIPVYRWGQA